MTKKAVVIGIDNYQGFAKLDGCVRDAESIAKQLKFNEDKSRNFEVNLITSDVTTERLHSEVEDLFTSDAETIVFYFAGHGAFDDTADFGFLVSENGTRHSWGLNLDTLVGFANNAYPKVTNTIIILDCCYSGRLADPGQRSGDSGSSVGKGVTIMTACNAKEVAMEYGGKGLFTSTLVNGLSGEAADIQGNITPAMLYAHVDRTLGAFEQRPLYKANVQAFSVIRKAQSRVLDEDLRLLPKIFDDSGLYPFGPECEPEVDRGEFKEEHQDIAFDQKKHETYRALQRLAKVGLVSPNDHFCMWAASMYATGCSLTGHGKHYKYLAAKEAFGSIDED